MLDTFTGKVWSKTLTTKGVTSWECVNLPLEYLPKENTIDPLGLFTEKENRQREHDQSLQQNTGTGLLNPEKQSRLEELRRKKAMGTLK